MVHSFCAVRISLLVLIVQVFLTASSHPLTNSNGPQPFHNFSTGRLSPSSDYQIVEAGLTFSIDCTFDTVGQHENIRWEKERNPLFIHKETNDNSNFEVSFKTNQDGNDVATLTVKTAASHLGVVRDSGYYRCSLHRPEEPQSPILLRQYVFVQAGKESDVVFPATITTPNEDQPSVNEVILGTHDLAVVRPSDPDVTLTLFKIRDRFGVKEPGPIQISTDGDSTWSYHPYEGFSIKTVTLAESGEFLIKSYRSQTNVTTNHSLLVIPKGLSMTASNSNPVEGSDVTLTCQSFRMFHSPRWFISFTDDQTNELEIDPSNPLVPGVRVELSGNDGVVTSRLIVSGIMLNMSGTYRCEAELEEDVSYNGRYLQETVRLTVIKQMTDVTENVIPESSIGTGIDKSTAANDHKFPTVSTVKTEHILMVEGEDTELTCNGFGNPMPQVTWLKDGAEVMNLTARTTLHQNGNVETVLLIPSARMEDSADYSCVIGSPSSWAGQTFQVTVGRSTDSRPISGVWLTNSVLFNFMDPRTLVILLVANGMVTFFLMIFVALLAKKVYKNFAFEAC